MALNCKFAPAGRTVLYNAINLPDGVVSLGELLFSYCQVNNAFKISAGVREIGVNCFALFRGNIYFDENSKIETIGSTAFHDCYAEGVLVLPQTVKNIEEFAFDGADFIGIVLPYGLETIEKYAFNTYSKCVLFIPDTVKYCGDKAYGKYAFTSLSTTDFRRICETDPEFLGHVNCSVAKSVLTLCDGDNRITTKADYAFVLPDCQKEGYQFIGWADASENIVNEYYVPCYDQTLRAKYIKLSETDGLTEATPKNIEAEKEYEVYVSSLANFYFVLDTVNTVRIRVSIEYLDISYSENDRWKPTLWDGKDEISGVYEYTPGTVLRIGKIEKRRPPYKIKIKVTVLS